MFWPRMKTGPVPDPLLKVQDPSVGLDVPFATMWFGLVCA
jgi:hypothetical protein